MRELKFYFAEHMEIEMIYLIIIMLFLFLGNTYCSILSIAFLFVVPMDWFALVEYALY